MLTPPENALYQRWFEPGVRPLWLINTGPLAFGPDPRPPGYHTHWLHRWHQELTTAQWRSVLPGTRDTPPGEAVDILWNWPKAKNEASLVIAWLSTGAAQGSTLWVAGENHAGVRSAPRLLTAAGWSVQKVGSMRRCSLYRAEPPATQPGFDLDTWFERFHLPDGQTILTLPGVFSHGRLDQGSAALLPWLPRQALRGHCLDFGCGGGVLSAALSALPDVQSITALDAHWLAVLSTRATARQLGGDWTVLWSQGWQQVTATFDAVITNPPFHTHRATDHSISADLLAGAPAHLTGQGHLLAVVNQHLPYRAALEDIFRKVDLLQRDNGFCIWHASQPSSDRFLHTEKG